MISNLGIKRVLIIGGGIGGMSAAIQLRKLGVEVDMVEQDAEWRVYGAGITISGPTLRAFKTIGIIDEIMEQGWCADGATLRDGHGNKIAELPTPRVAGPEVPGGGAILRPVLARILSKATLASGTKVRLGTSVESFSQEGTMVYVSFTDGSRDDYDLVIGADGLNSPTRKRLLPDSPLPRYTGQGSWRAVVPRMPGIDGPTMFLGHTAKAGVNPVSRDEMYLFCLDPRPVNEHVPKAQWHTILAGLLTEFSGPVAEIREALTADSQIVYRPLETIMLPAPWHKGRVVLIGDAVHATTPHLASGAGAAVEDAIVLVEELDRGLTVEAALQCFVQRRLPRCSLAVNNSLRLGQLEIAGGSTEEHSALMRSSMAALVAPI